MPRPRVFAAVGQMHALLLLAVACLALAASAGARGATNQLQSIETTAMGSGAVAIRLTLAHKAPAPSVFTVDDPARLSIDLPDTTLALAKRYRRVDQAPVQAITAAATDRRTRIVIELSTMVAYDIQRQGNQLVVRLGNQLGDQLGDQPDDPSASARTATANAPNRDQARASTQARAQVIDNIDFRRGPDGTGRIDITLDGDNARVNVTRQNGRVVASLPFIALPEQLQKRYDVVDFATPVKTIDAQSAGRGARITVKPIAGRAYEQLAYQTGRHFYIELQPLATQTSGGNGQAGDKRYHGQKISLSFQNVDVRRVLQIIADVAHVNMVVDDNVSGQMALQLNDVPWDQALDIIMNAKDLGMERADNVITVAPLAQIAARKKAEEAARQATQNLAPLHSEIIQINYAQAADIAALLDNGSGGGAANGPTIVDSGGRQSFLSPRGRVTVDNRTNSLLIDDTRAKLDDIRALVSHLDIPVRQVLIQARIVVANRSFSRELGVSSSVNDKGAFESPKGGNYITNTGFSVDLPTPTSPAGLLTTSIIGDTFSLNLALSALESENRGQIISSPRVITANGQGARIAQGQEIPYLEAASSGAATVAFKKAELSLLVTPQITPDQRVIMHLTVTQNQPNYANLLPGTNQPPIDTREIDTNVLVKDGETVVLGGIYEQENRSTNSHVPFLGRIPLIGALFSGTQKSQSKRELLLFITPKILHDSMANN